MIKWVNYTLRLTATTQTGAASSTVDRPAVAISNDDGATWQPVVVSHETGDTWLARLINPGSGFVSLRVSATNTAGNAVEQTVIRGYGLS